MGQLLVRVTAAGGSSPLPPITPSNSLPGTNQLTSLAGGVLTVALVMAVIAVIVGGGIYAVGHRGGFAAQAHRGQQLLVGGVIGAVVVGAAHTLIGWSYGFGGGF